MTALIILDRDGVINEDSDHYIRSPEEWRPVPFALEAIAKLCASGWTVVVATNQAGVAKGVFTRDTLDAIHAKLQLEVARAGGRIERIYACLHHPDDVCACRKPQPGMLLQACADFGVQPSQVPFVGDSLRDLEAAAAAGCQPVLVMTGNGPRTLRDPKRPEGTRVFRDLLEFATKNFC